MEQDYLCISWKNLPWVLFKRRIFHLQCKIYEAHKKGNFKLLRRLQKLLIYSNSSHFISTKLLSDSSKEYRMAEDEKYILASGIRAILKNKSILNKLRLTGSCRNLEFKKILIIQYILRLALEPIYYEKSNWLMSEKKGQSIKIMKDMESYLEEESESNWEKILQFEVKLSLKDMKSGSIMKILSLPNFYKLFIYKSLTSDYLDNGTVNQVWMNFLTSLLLDKKVSFNRSFENQRLFESDFALKRLTFGYSRNVFCFLKQGVNFYHCVDKIKNNFKNRGLKLDLSSMRISTLKQGFDFFGWFLKRRPNKKVYISVSQNDWVLYKRNFKSFLNSYHNSNSKINKINSLHNKWFHKYRSISRCVLKSKFYFIRRSVLKYSKSLKILEKKILFESFRFRSLDPSY